MIEISYRIGTRRRCRARPTAKRAAVPAANSSLSPVKNADSCKLTGQKRELKLQQPWAHPLNQRKILSFPARDSPPSGHSLRSRRHCVSQPVFDGSAQWPQSERGTAISVGQHRGEMRRAARKRPQPRHQRPAAGPQSPRRTSHPAPAPQLCPALAGSGSWAPSNISAWMTALTKRLSSGCREDQANTRLFGRERSNSDSTLASSKLLTCWQSWSFSTLALLPDQMANEWAREASRARQRPPSQQTCCGCAWPDQRRAETVPAEPCAGSGAPLPPSIDCVARRAAADAASARHPDHESWSGAIIGLLH